MPSPVNQAAQGDDDGTVELRAIRGQSTVLQFVSLEPLRSKSCVLRLEDRSASLRALLDTDGPDLKPISGMAASKVHAEGERALRDVESAQMESAQAGAELLSNLLLDESARVARLHFTDLCKGQFLWPRERN